MNAHKHIAIALAALLVFAGGAAALPGNAPDNPGTNTADGHAPDDPGADTADDANESVMDGNARVADDPRDENASEKPPTEMPGPVPDHVSEIHQLIREELAGTLGNDSLGDAISGLVGGGEDAGTASQPDSADEQAGNGDGNGPARSEDVRSAAGSVGVAASLPQQAADHVAAIHDAITTVLDGNVDDSIGAQVGGAAR
ncbi:MAG: hypothetical protein ABEJ92_01200 [Halobacteriales archaeon]